MMIDNGIISTQVSNNIDRDTLQGRSNPPHHGFPSLDLVATGLKIPGSFQKLPKNITKMWRSNIT